MLAFTGPGTYSLDAAMGLELSGPVFGASAAAVGIGAGLLVGMWRRHQEARRAAEPEPAQFEEPRWAA